MRRRLVLVYLAGAAAVCGAGPLAVPAAGAAVPAGAVRAAGSWGRAIEVPGLAALNKGGNVNVFSVSCTSPGNCVADGGYADGHHHSQAFLAVERRGVWGRAMEVPGLGALNKGGSTDVSVSCASAGNCGAGGSYTDGHGHSQGFVTAEKNGRWGRPIKVPGLGALNKGGNAGVGEIACPSAGNCAAAGGYTDGHRNPQGFVATEKNGVWGQAIEVPGPAAQDPGAIDNISSLSCASAGNCAAAGDYTDSGGNGQGFVVSEKNGVWHQAIEVPGLGALNKGENADAFSVSCASPGNNCAVGGDYTDSGENSQGFVAVEKNGVWGQAINVPGLRALNNASEGGNAEVTSVSCASAGNCAAVGSYGEPYGVGFMSTEKNDVWGWVTDGPAGGRFAGISAVSCASPGNCAEGGLESNDIGDVVQAFVDVERDGNWAAEIDVPGLDALNKDGYAQVQSVSCPPAGGCAAAGYYTDGRGRVQGFVVTRTR